MDQLQGTRSDYNVVQGETVTIEVEATHVQNLEAFYLDGTEKDQISDSPRMYEFTVTKNSGSFHSGMFTFHFPPGTPDNAKYQLYLTGDKGNTTRHTGPYIKNKELPARFDVIFWIR